jgi:sec-independent protein translocase protein TatA
MPFNLGGGELVFLLIIVLIVFGAGKLPDVFGQLGRGVRTFRDEAANTDKPAASTTTPASTTEQPKSN